MITIPVTVKPYLSTEPKWNWNFLNAFHQSTLRPLSTEPKWNWNKGGENGQLKPGGSFNRTKVELKFDIAVWFILASLDFQPNQSGIEIALPSTSAFIIKRSFNRTKVELKLRIKHYICIAALTFQPNQSGIEMLRGYYWTNRKSILSTEPKWNWNWYGIGLPCMTYRVFQPNQSGIEIPERNLRAVRKAPFNRTKVELKYYNKVTLLAIGNFQPNQSGIEI